MVIQSSHTIHHEQSIIIVVNQRGTTHTHGSRSPHPISAATLRRGRKVSTNRSLALLWERTVCTFGMASRVHTDHEPCVVKFPVCWDWLGGRVRSMDNRVVRPGGTCSCLGCIGRTRQVSCTVRTCHALYLTCSGSRYGISKVNCLCVLTRVPIMQRREDFWWWSRS